MITIPNKQDVFFDPAIFAETFLKIQNKEKKTVSLVYNKAQRDFLSKRTGRDIILKARQLGFSTLLQAELFRIVSTSSATTLTLTHLDATTQAMRRLADRFFEFLPQGFRPNRKYANSTITTYPDFDSEAIIGTAGSSQGGRGINFSHAHFSEFAFYKDPDSILAGALQAGNPQVVIESTPNGAQGAFFTMCMDALRGEGVWKLHFYQWWWEDSYRLPLYGEVLTYTPDELSLVKAHGLDAEQIKWRRYKINELGELFFQEYPEDVITCFRVSGGGVFNPLPHNISEFAVIAYQDGYYYVAGLDWGQDNDYTALSIMRIRTGEAVQEVYLNRWRRQSWGSIRAEIIDKLREYRVEKLLPERNSIGSVNIEDLVRELDEAKLGTAIQAFYTDQRSKDGLVKNMQNGLSEYGLVLLNIDYASNELRTYITKQSANGLYSYEAPSGGHDDTVMARMLAYYGASQLWI